MHALDLLEKDFKTITLNMPKGLKENIKQRTKGNQENVL